MSSRTPSAPSENGDGSEHDPGRVTEMSKRKRSPTVADFLEWALELLPRLNIIKSVDLDILRPQLVKAFVFAVLSLTGAGIWFLVVKAPTAFDALRASVKANSPLAELNRGFLLVELEKNGREVRILNLD